MFKYEYVTVKTNDKAFSVKCSEYREVIDIYAQKGYRYVGFIPTNISNYGRLKEFDLIFEMQQ